MTVVDLYTVQIIDDLDDPPSYVRPTQAIAEIEENLTLLLPPNYRAVIRPWDDTTTQEEA